MLTEVEKSVGWSWAFASVAGGCVSGATGSVFLGIATAAGLMSINIMILALGRQFKK